MLTAVVLIRALFVMGAVHGVYEVASARVESKPASTAMRALASVEPALKAKSQVPILLPSTLPSPMSRATYAQIDNASADGYSIGLWYKSGDLSDATFAAFFGAQKCVAGDCGDPGVNNVIAVTLSHGVRGYFRAVSCGGSCAPANIWWDEKHIEYQIQLELRSDSSIAQQRLTMTEVADSAILAGPK